MVYEGPLMSILGPRCLDPTQKQFGYLMKVNRHVEHITVAMDKLKARRDDILLKVQEAELKQEERKNEVKLWLKMVTEIETKVGRIQSRYTQRLLCFKCCGLNCWSSYRIGKAAFKELSRVEELIKNGVFVEVATKRLQVPAKELPGTSRVLGMESNLQKVLSYIDGDEGTIGIWGMGGVGKTTLLRNVNNAFISGSERSTQFHRVIWVVASRGCKLEKLQQDIAKKLGLQEKDSSTDECAANIYSFLKNKNFLLLLDDLWEYMDLSKVGIPDPSGKSVTAAQHKHKIVLTTRFEGVCGAMGAHTSRLKVKCLEWDEAWQLFKQQISEQTINSDPNIPAIAEDVARECRGLPIALITIGRAMSTKTTPKDWTHARTLLRSSRHHEIPGVHHEIPGMEDKNMLNLLKFSYDSLPDDATRGCFLCCSLWPEDYTIDPDILIECWMGLCLIDEPDEIDNTYNKGHSLIGVLKEACLLEAHGHDDRDVKMHDVIRDLALWIASECGKKPNKWMVQAGVGLSDHLKLAEKWRRAEAVERVSLMTNPLKILPNQLPARPNLTVLMLQENKNLKEIPHGFFRCMPALTYLDLSNTIIEELPVEIGSLVALKYLNLSTTSITKLPKELASLQQLKYLLLKDTNQLSEIPPGVISGLRTLQVLDMYASSYVDWEGENGASLDELSPGLLKSLGISLTSLNALRKISEKFPTRRLCIKRMPCPEFMNLRPSTSVAHLGSLNIMKSLQQLMIRSCTILTELTVEDDEEIDIEDWSLPKLEILDLINLYQLQTINWNRVVLESSSPLFAR